MLLHLIAFPSRVDWPCMLICLRFLIAHGARIKIFASALFQRKIVSICQLLSNYFPPIRRVYKKGQTDIDRLG